jgi:pyruvate dehydrogenase E1 component
VAITAFASIVQDYIAAKPWARTQPGGRMIALVGDAELDEGNIYECLQEGWKHDLRNTWWVIDYNRQSLDGVVREGLWQRIEASSPPSAGCEGAEIRRAPAGRLPGTGRRGVARLDRPLSKPALFGADFSGRQAAWRKRLTDEIGMQPGVADLLAARSDDQLSDLMGNLGGHCLETLIDTFESIDHDRPTVFLAYTIKGWGTPLAGHKDNHAGLMTKAQMETFQERVGVVPGTEWETFGAIPSPDARTRRS